VCGLEADAGRVEEGAKLRVVAVVEHDEAGVDVPGAARPLDRDRVSVTAEAPVGFEQRDLVAAVQAVSRDQAGNAAADDRNPHACGAGVGERAVPEGPSP